MKISKAIILAAGRGVRMGARGKVIPKGLIEVGNRQLVVRSLDSLFDAGVDEVTLVTGHLAEAFQPVKQRYGSRVIELHNPDFATKGSFESLRRGLEHMDGPCLLLESDIIYEPRAIATARDSRHENVIVISGPTGSSDEVYVWTTEKDDALLFDAMSKSKTMKDRQPSGELVGIHKLGSKLQQRILEAAAVVSATADYENAINVARSHVDVHCELVPDLIWAEIDNEDMYARVNALIEPRLRKLEIAQ